MATTQRNRGIQVKSPLGADTLLFQQLTGTERLSQPFELHLTLLSEQGDINPDDLLGQDMVVSFQPEKGPRRYLHGVVTELAQSGYNDRYHEYSVTLRPWLWFLTRTSDCRIFQNKSVPEIFEQVVKEYGFSDYKLRLEGQFPKREYCVQYRETDFNFISRLLEQEGIYYFFVHEEGRHVMVLANDVGAHSSVEGYKKVPFFPPGGETAQRERDHLSVWTHTRAVHSGAYVTTDFDFKAPRKALLKRASVSRKHARSDFEIFDYPAELAVPEASESERIAKLRMEELQATHMVARGRGNAAGLTPGFRFQLEGHPRADFNIEYLIIAAHYTLTSDTYSTGAVGASDEVEIAVEAIPAETPFRAPRVTPKPVMQGSQTAIVVGKSGDEITVDNYGRVKVQFHWDRYGKNDENSSCWVRVAQLWAGKNWGGVHLPRIGQEVIVSFLEGDPDRPIITGRVYNGDQMPPYDLPANATRSGIKSRSTKGGSAENFNELRFEDKKGEEEIYIHAEKNLTVVIKNDHSISVGNDETLSVKHDRKRTVENDETVTISKNQTTSIGEKETHKVGKDRETSIGENETLKVGKSRKADISENDSADVGKKYVLTAGDQITLETGQSRIVMKKNGDIEISGTNIKLKATAKIDLGAGQEIKASGTQIKASGTQVAVKGTQTNVEGTAMLDLKASGIASLKGSLTKIG